MLQRESARAPGAEFLRSERAKGYVSLRYSVTKTDRATLARRCPSKKRDDLTVNVLPAGPQALAPGELCLTADPRRGSRGR